MLVGVTTAVPVGCSGVMVGMGVGVTTAVSVLPVTSTTSAMAVVGAGAVDWQAARNQKAVVTKKSVIDKKRFFVYMRSINPPMDSIESHIIWVCFISVESEEFASPDANRWASRDAHSSNSFETHPYYLYSGSDTGETRAGT
jgi:hypothetical protein